MNKKMHSILERFFDFTTPEKLLSNLEVKMEKDLINLFNKLGIQASLKSEKKSLPFQFEVVEKLPYESYVNGMLEYERTFRKIAKELLDKDVSKIRFFVDITAVDSEINIFPGFINYSFKYYIHN